MILALPCCYLCIHFSILENNVSWVIETTDHFECGAINVYVWSVSLLGSLGLIQKCEGVGYVVMVYNGYLMYCSPMLVPRQLRFSLYSGAVITEGWM